MTKKNGQPELIPRAEAPAAPVHQPDPPKPEAAEPQAPEQEQPKTVPAELTPAREPEAQPPAIPGEIVVPLSESNALLRMAIDKDLDLEKLKTLIDMRDREEDRRAQSLFEFHFAEMQKDYVPVAKSKVVMNKDKTAAAYSYCPLPDILETYTPIISSHGFGYRFDITDLPDNLIRIACHLTGYGHTRTTAITLPVLTAGMYMNAIQSRGATIEYGRRYTFMNVTGCIVSDEDGSAEPKLAPEMARKHAALLIQFAPKGMQKELLDALKNTADDSLEEFVRTAEVLKERCQMAIRNVDKRRGAEAKAKAVSGLVQVTNLDELAAWESYCEGL